MKKPIQAALLSALLFPGSGHLYLKSILRGLVLAGISFAALAIMVTETLQKVALIMNQLETTGSTISSEEMTAILAQSPDQAISLASVFFLVCWVGGIIDAYWIGNQLDKKGQQPNGD